MAYNYNQGFFTPSHPEKYEGDVTKIFYRSSWELRFNQFLDSNPNVLSWSSEPFAIPYLKPTDRKIHRYFPDYYVRVVTRENLIKKFIVEIKPKAQARTSKSRLQHRRMIENVTYAINKAKWTAAQRFCAENHIEFKLLTEDQLFGTFGIPKTK